MFRQRIHLEKTVESLKEKLQREERLHRNQIVRSMQENAELIKEINALRARLQGDVLPEKTESDESYEKQLIAQKQIIEQLRLELQIKEDRIVQLEGSIVSRPVSRERLTPRD